MIYSEPSILSPQSSVPGMYGSDMALFTASRPNELVDAHVVSEPFPKPDDCQQDWELVNSHSTSISVTAEERQAVDTTVDDESFLMFEARRKLNTDDPQDIVLIRDSLLAIPEQRIISAWGNTPEVSFHGIDDVARGSIRLYKTEVDEPDFDALMARDADGSFFLGARIFTIPANDTTYQEFCITRQDLIDQGVPDTTDLMSVIGFRPIVDDGPSARYVHHYVVTGIMNASDDACSDGEGGMDLVYVWAPGDGPFALPEFLGASLFGVDGFQGFSVEIHYDNPNMDEGIVDSSGVEIFYSTTPRETEVAILQVGDPFIQLFSQPVGEGYNMHQFDCPGSCSSLYLQDDEPVTVIREYLHMHATGVRMTNEQIRDGEAVRTAATEVWDFDANGNIPMKQDAYELQPGDGFRTKCYFNGEADTVFGLGSREEMCIAFLYYYPRRKITVTTDDGEFNIPFICGYGMDFFEEACDSPHSGAVLENEASLDREFGKQKAQCLVGTNQGSVQIDGGSSPAPAPDDGSTPVTPGEWPAPEEGVPAPTPMGEADSGSESDSSPAPAPDDGSTPVTPGEWPEPEEGVPAPSPMGEAGSGSEAASSPAPAPDDGSTPCTPGEVPEPDEPDPSPTPLEQTAVISSAPTGGMLSSLAMMGVGVLVAGIAA